MLNINRKKYMEQHMPSEAGRQNVCSRYIHSSVPYYVPFDWNLFSHTLLSPFNSIYVSINLFYHYAYIITIDHVDARYFSKINKEEILLFECKRIKNEKTKKKYLTQIM